MEEQKLALPAFEHTPFAPKRSLQIVSSFLNDDNRFFRMMVACRSWSALEPEMHTIVLFSVGSEARRRHFLKHVASWNVAANVHFVWHRNPLQKATQMQKQRLFVEDVIKMGRGDVAEADLEYPALASLECVQGLDWETTMILTADDDDEQHPQRLLLYKWAVEQEPSAHVWRLPARMWGSTEPTVVGNQLWNLSCRGNVYRDSMLAMTSKSLKDGIGDKALVGHFEKTRLRDFVVSETPWRREGHPLSTCWNILYESAQVQDWQVSFSWSGSTMVQNLVRRGVDSPVFMMGYSFAIFKFVFPTSWLIPRAVMFTMLSNAVMQSMLSRLLREPGARAGRTTYAWSLAMAAIGMLLPAPVSAPSSSR